MIFAETEKGKKMPLDAKPLTLFHLEPVGFGQVIAVAVKAYQSHYATCPDADDWRKARRNKGG